MFRLNHIPHEGECRRELVLARITINRMLRRQGHFTRLRTQLQKLAERIDIDLVVEQANANLSGTLLHAGYLRIVDPPTPLQVFSGLRGSWFWPGERAEICYSLIVIPRELGKLIDHTRFWTKITDRIIAEELDRFLRKLQERVQIESVPVMEKKIEQVTKGG